MFILAFYNQPKFCPKPEWNQLGEALSHSCHKNVKPIDIFIDIYDTVYACCCEKSLMKTPGRFPNSHTLTPIHEYKKPPQSFFVVFNGDIYVDTGVKNKIRIWKPWWQSRSSWVELNRDKSCYALFIDTNDTIYCSMKDKHQVIKKSLNDRSNPVIAAGIYDSSGSGSDRLKKPHGIFVDTNFDLYVADCENHRIQRFKRDVANGETVLNDTRKINNKELHCPTDVILDADSNLYIVDSGNNRVIVVTPNSAYSRCLIGCESEDESDPIYYLDKPNSISFDRFGNIFVVSNTRDEEILKFILANKDCGELDKYSIEKNHY